MAYLELKGVAKSYGTGTQQTQVLAGIDLEIEQGDFVVIVGFSGSGKTTLIQLIAGLLRPDTGTLRLQGEPIKGPGPERGVVFQNYSLLPWLSVFGNVELAVKHVFPKLSRATRAAHVMRYIDMVNLSAAADKKPGELSGGMKQRVSLARALAMQPAILLMDEPFSALDALTRANLQDELIRIWEQDRRTVVMITNDVDEAILLADRIIPLTPGPRAILGRPFAVDLARPRNRAALNRDPRFKQIRNAITNYLMEINTENQQLHRAHKRRIRLPDLNQPVHHWASA